MEQAGAGWWCQQAVVFYGLPQLLITLDYRMAFDISLSIIRVSFYYVEIFLKYFTIACSLLPCHRRPDFQMETTGSGNGLNDKNS